MVAGVPAAICSPIPRTEGAKGDLHDGGGGIIHKMNLGGENSTTKRARMGGGRTETRAVWVGKKAMASSPNRVEM